MSTVQLLVPPADVGTSDVTPGSADAARISFRQPISTSGFIDAAWWPRTLDLTREVPALFEVLWTADREINRITYNTAAWDSAPRRMIIEGRTVRLGGFTTSDPLTVRLSDAWGRERREREADGDDLLGCSVCSHPLADHDAIGLRYCRATQAHALPRHCICRER